MFILGGIGHNREEIPIGIVEKIKEVDYVFLEGYTNFIDEDTLRYLRSLREDIVIVDRNFVEGELEDFILKNKDRKIMLLVSGNPLFATTHAYFLKFCKDNNIDFKVIGSSSIFDEVGKTGLFLYKFGKIVSIPFHESESFFEDIIINYKNGMHTLILLDLDPISGRYLDLREALNRIINLDRLKNTNMFSDKTEIVLCSNLGREGEKIIYTDIRNAMKLDLNPPICIIIPGRLNEIEKEILKCMTSY